MAQATLMFLILFVMAQTVSAESKKTENVDQSTPRKTIIGFMSAMEKRSWAEGFQYLTVELQQDFLERNLHIFSEYRIEKPVTKRALDALRSKHSLSWDAKKQRLGKSPLAKVKDKAALFKDLVALKEKMTSRRSNPREFTEPKFSKYRIEKNAATAVMSVRGRQVQVVRFRRVRKKWFIVGFKEVNKLSKSESKHQKPAGNAADMKQKVARMKAIAALTKIGAYVEIDRAQPGHKVKRVFFNGAKFKNDDLIHLKAFPEIKKISIWSSNVTDAGLAHMKDLKNLEYLSLLRSSKINGSGLKHLKGMKKLASLYLWSTSTTDNGLAHVKSFSRLKVLYLNATKITDAGLVHLSGLRNLAKLNLTGTAVTDEAVRKLRVKLPKCKITR